MVGGTLTTKYFPNLFEATQFAVYKAPLHSVYSMYKVEENGTAQ
jgi:hypothetical protein